MASIILISYFFCKVYLLVGFLGSNACRVVYVNDLN